MVEPPFLLKDLVPQDPRMNLVIKLCLFLYLFPLIYPLALNPSAVLVAEVAIAVLCLWRGETWQAVLRKLLIAAPFLALWIFGLQRIDSLQIPPYEIREVYIESEGRYATCGTGAYYMRLGLAELWTFLLWPPFAAAKKVLSDHEGSRRPVPSQTRPAWPAAPGLSSRLTHPVEGRNPHLGAGAPRWHP